MAKRSNSPVTTPAGQTVVRSRSVEDRDEAVDRFVEAWGRMGSVWGISRTMAEVHALLYITGESMCIDDIMARLQISRGNASMSIRSLLDWGIISRAHRRGDRKDYFQAEQDVWTVFRTIVRERMKREVDPLLVSLHELRDTQEEARNPDDIDQRLDAMIDFFEMGTKLADRFIGPAGPGLRLVASVLSKAPAMGSGRRGSRSPDAGPIPIDGLDDDGLSGERAAP